MERCVFFLCHIWIPHLALLWTSPKHVCDMNEPTPEIVLRKENPFMLSYQRKDSGSEDERDDRIPDLEKDDFAIRRARLNQPKLTLPFSHYLLGSYTNKDGSNTEEGRKRKKKQECVRCASLLFPYCSNWVKYLALSVFINLFSCALFPVSARPLGPTRTHTSQRAGTEPNRPMGNSWVAQ